MKRLFGICILLVALLLTGCMTPATSSESGEHEKKVAAAKQTHLEQTARSAQMDAGVGYVAMSPGSVWTEDNKDYFYLYYSDIPKIIGIISREKDVRITGTPRPTTIGLESDNRLTGFYFSYEPNQ